MCQPRQPRARRSLEPQRPIHPSLRGAEVTHAALRLSPFLCVTRRSKFRRQKRALLPQGDPMATYVLPELGYDYNALEPHVSGKIMELHHSKHHAAYVKGANDTL